MRGVFVNYEKCMSFKLKCVCIKSCWTSKPHFIPLCCVCSILPPRADVNSYNKDPVYKGFAKPANFTIKS